jgi:signal transduction histidine kinase
MMRLSPDSMSQPKKQSQPQKRSDVDFLEKIAQYCQSLKQAHLWAETRTQIWLWYFGLMVLLIGGSIPAVYHALYREVDRRTKIEIYEEIQEFRELAVTLPTQDEKALQDRIGQYLQNDQVDDQQFSILILNETYTRSIPTRLPVALQPGSPLMEQWRSLKTPRQGEEFVDDPTLGKIIYQAEPIYGAGQVRGVFVVAFSTADEWMDVGDVVRFVQGSLLLLLGVASLLAWLITGRILAPLRAVSQTARRISESDLSLRIPVKGKGELAEVSQTLNDMMDRLQEAFQSQQEFVNDASHELRTPITIIQGHLDLMGDDPEEQAEVLDLVNSELDRMNRFVSDLLVLAKAGRPDFIRLESIELQAFTEELFTKAKVIANCDCQLEGYGTGDMQTDPQRLTQAILNLVENANQHTPVQGTIAIGSSRSRKHTRFWVRDTGVGIAAADQQRIFERFARASDTVRRSEGAGLGLAIVQAIAKGLGGRVELKSAPGKGSTFTLIFSNHKKEYQPKRSTLR